jgi:hypothetical protein
MAFFLPPCPKWQSSRVDVADFTLYGNEIDFTPYSRSGAQLMKAMVQDTYGSAEVLELREIENPEIADDQVLVRVRAAGVNPADSLRVKVS